MISQYVMDDTQEDPNSKIAKLKVRRENDLKWVISKPEGRRVMWRLMSECGVFRGSYSGETNSTFFNEGRRDIGLLILREVLEAKPEAFNQMRAEHAADQLIERNS